MRAGQYLIILTFLLGSFCSQTRHSAKIRDFSAVGKAEAQEYEPTFFDTLNRGHELALTAQDFMPAAQPAANQESGAVFQVQFFAATQRDVAEREKSRIEETLDVPVTMVFEAPYYKLRAGRFSTRAQAEEFKQKMFEIGHRNAWIVQKGK